MDTKIIMQWGLLAVLLIGALYLLTTGNVIFGIVFLVIFMFVFWTIWNTANNPERLSKQELIRIAAVMLETKYRRNILVDGSPILHDDVDLGDKWKFVFKQRDPNVSGGWAYLPVTVDTYSGELGEKAGVRWDKLNLAENFLNKDSTPQQQPALTPEQIQELKEVIASGVDDQVTQQKLLEGDGEE